MVQLLALTGFRAPSSRPSPPFGRRWSSGAGRAAARTLPTVFKLTNPTPYFKNVNVTIFFTTRWVIGCKWLIEHLKLYHLFTFFFNFGR